MPADSPPPAAQARYYRPDSRRWTSWSPKRNCATRAPLPSDIATRLIHFARLQAAAFVAAAAQDLPPFRPPSEPRPARRSSQVVPRPAEIDSTKLPAAVAERPEPFPAAAFPSSGSTAGPVPPNLPDRWTCSGTGSGSASSSRFRRKRRNALFGSFSRRA
uniref:(northern house mosquito) hypothetical protein n=1 Tax=Culex pipiens TaxID=7175 RepID=A0A8D8MUC0_CULPI